MTASLRRNTGPGRFVTWLYQVASNIRRLDSPPPSVTRTLKMDSLLTVLEAAAELRIARTHLYKIIKQSKIRTLKIGACRLVPYREI